MELPRSFCSGEESVDDVESRVVELTLGEKAEKGLGCEENGLCQFMASCVWSLSSGQWGYDTSEQTAGLSTTNVRDVINTLCSTVLRFA